MQILRGSLISPISQLCVRVMIGRFKSNSEILFLKYILSDAVCINNLIHYQSFITVIFLYTLFSDSKEVMHTWLTALEAYLKAKVEHEAWLGQQRKKGW